MIKVEHPASGDPQRGLVSSGLVPGGSGVNFMFEIPNRGKRSVGLDISTDDGRELLYRLVERADNDDNHRADHCHHRTIEAAGNDETVGNG